MYYSNSPFCFLIRFIEPSRLSETKRYTINDTFRYINYQVLVVIYRVRSKRASNIRLSQHVKKVPVF